MDSGAPKDPYVRAEMGVQIPHAKEQLLGKRTCPGMPDVSKVK